MIRRWELKWDMLESMSHTTVQLVTRSATADTLSATENADE
jgi:hypothetical protein